jgi:hypothetical protein
MSTVIENGRADVVYWRNVTLVTVARLLSVTLEHALNTSGDHKGITASCGSLKKTLPEVLTFMAQDAPVSSLGLDKQNESRQCLG